MCGFYFQLLYNENVNLLKDITSLITFTRNKQRKSKYCNLPEDWNSKIRDKIVEPMRTQHWLGKTIVNKYSYVVYGPE